jgi:hypothetical protein
MTYIHADLSIIEMPFVEAQRANQMLCFGQYIWCFVLIFLTPWFGSHHQPVQSFQAILVADSARHKNMKNHLLTSSSSTSNERVPSANPVLLSDNAPSWQDLRKRVLDTPTGVRLEAEQTDGALGFGPPHTALVAYF